MFKDGVDNELIRGSHDNIYPTWKALHVSEVLCYHVKIGSKRLEHPTQLKIAKETLLLASFYKTVFMWNAQTLFVIQCG